MLKINYNHSSDNLTEAIGLTGDDVNYMKCAVVYSILNPKVFATSLFDKEEEIPDNMKSSSGMIEGMMQLMKSDSMIAASLLNFHTIKEKIVTIYNIIQDRSAFEEALNEQYGNDELKKSLARVVTEMKVVPVKEIINFIKESNGDFNLFYNKFKEKIGDADSEDYDI